MCLPFFFCASDRRQSLFCRYSYIGRCSKGLPYLFQCCKLWGSVPKGCHSQYVSNTLKTEWLYLTFQRVVILSTFRTDRQPNWNKVYLLSIEGRQLCLPFFFCASDRRQSLFCRYSYIGRCSKGLPYLFQCCKLWGSVPKGCHSQYVSNTLKTEWLYLTFQRVVILSTFRTDRQPNWNKVYL